MKLTARGRAGHGSMINPDNAVTRIAQAVARIGAHEWPVRLTPAMEVLLATVADLAGTEATPENAEALVEEFGSAARMLGAVIRNTTNPTMLGAGYKANVIPTEATAHIDGRSLPGYEDEFFATLAELVGDGIEVEYLSNQRPWETPYDGELVDAMHRSLLAEDPDALVAPFLMSGGTDAKHFRKLGHAVLRLHAAAAARRPRLHRPLPRRRRAGAGRRAGVRRAGVRPVPRRRLNGLTGRTSGAGSPNQTVARCRMILRRSTTRRVPSGRTLHPVELPAAVLGPVDEHPGHGVARELPRDGQLLELPLDPRGRAGAPSPGAHGHSPETSSRAATMASGRVSSSTVRAALSWAAVRAPTIGARRAGPVADPDQRHLQRRPVEAVGGAATASTTARPWSSR